MESEYVRRSVGQALTLGLAEVATVRPADPVEYLALWLLQHKRNLNEKDKVLYHIIIIIIIIILKSNVAFLFLTVERLQMLWKR